MHDKAKRFVITDYGIEDGQQLAHLAPSLQAQSAFRLARRTASPHLTYSALTKNHGVKKSCEKSWGQIPS